MDGPFHSIGFIYIRKYVQKYGVFTNGKKRELNKNLTQYIRGLSVNISRQRD